MHGEVENSMGATTTSERALPDTKMWWDHLCKRKYGNYTNVNKPSVEVTTV